MADLKGKVALVTGGARRLGRAIVEALAADGAKVAIHYHASAESADETAAAVRAAGHESPELFAADLTDAVQAEDLPRRVVTNLGRLDILINSAAVMLRQPFGTVTSAQWDAVLNLNLRAYFFVAQGAAPALRAARGAIVNISDLAAHQVWPSYLPHTIAKSGIEALTRGLARVLAPEVTVNAIAPGGVLLPDDTTAEEAAHTVAQVPLSRLGHPSDVTAAVRYLLASRYVTGTTMVIDGGRLLR